MVRRQSALANLHSICALQLVICILQSRGAQRQGPRGASCYARNVWDRRLAPTRFEIGGKPSRFAI